MRLVESFLTKNPCYTAGRKITVKGLMLHSVGCPQPRAQVFLDSWNHTSFGSACVHGFIDGNDGTVYQALPWNHRGWHCGSGSKGSGNNTHIGVEMCEPACIRYTSGSGFTCSDLAKARASAVRTYEVAVELFAMLCKKFGLDPLADGVVISHREGHARGIATNHGDPEHLWKGLGLPYTMDGFRKAVKAAMSGKAEGTQASVFLGISDEKAAERIGVLCAEDMKTSGILASVSAAQFILESGYGRTELAQKANNCFGMKCVLSGNTWNGSIWDGTNKYRKKTQEDDGTGKLYTVTADFRKYVCVEQSIADHSAYLLGAMNGKKKRYAGLAGEKDYRKAVRIIKDGGYATDSFYVQKICAIIEKYEALHCGGGRGVKLFFVRAKPCLPLWSFSLIRKTELLVAFNITSGIEVSFFSAKSRTLLIYRYQKKEDTLRNLYEKKKEKLISYICFLASLGLKVTILFSVILNFLIFPVSESLNLYSNSSTHSLMRYKSIKQLKTKIQEDIY